MILGHWQTSLDIGEELPFGFIYRITNRITGKMYIGKKQMVFHVTKKPLKGKTKKRHTTTESDWKTYTGSCNELNGDIETLGKDNFTFEIILLCDSKSQLAYREAELQFKEEVLLREDYYNGTIKLRVSRIKNTPKKPGSLKP